MNQKAKTHRGNLMVRTDVLVSFAMSMVQPSLAPNCSVLDPCGSIPIQLNGFVIHCGDLRSIWESWPFDRLSCLLDVQKLLKAGEDVRDFFGFAEVSYGIGDSVVVFQAK
jgi:hypothetical protein